MRKNSFSLSLLIFYFVFFFITSGVCQDSLTANELIANTTQRRISMDFQDASLKNILKIFSQQAGLNFIASQQIQDRTVTLYLENVSVQDALDKLLAANNLGYELHNNIFIVTELGGPILKTITKVIPLKYAQVSNSPLAAEISSKLGTGTTGTIKESIEKVLTTNGKIIEDPRTNSLIITDIPTHFGLIEQIIEDLDTPAPQVLVEVEMLDVTKDVIDDLGVRFSGEWLNFQGSGRSTHFPFGKDWVKSATAANAFTMGSLSATGLTAVLDFLTTQSDTKYLARPRLYTLNNQPAEIKITTQEAIGTVTVTVASEGVSEESTQAERYQTGIYLRFTPQVNIESGEITMYIEPQVSEASTSSLGSSYRDPEDRGTKSVVRIRDGETIMIGGLLRRRYEATIRKIPFLGDLPIVGWLFKHQDETTDDEREMIVFLTPHIIEEKEASQIVYREIPASQKMLQQPIEREQLIVFGQEETD